MRPKLSRDNFCRSIAAQLPSPRGQFQTCKKSPLLWGRGNLGGIFRDNLGEGSCESKIAARQWGVNSCRKASRCLAGPSGTIFRPEFSSRMSLNIFEDISRFVFWNRMPLKFDQNPRYFSMLNSQANPKKNSQQFSGRQSK